LFIFYLLFIIIFIYRISEQEKILLVNADKFLLLSEQRNYFYHQKEFYTFEIDRISKLYEDKRFKKREYKKKYIEVRNNMNREVERLEKDIEYFREKVKH
jgi:hypothetical protein